MPLSGSPTQQKTSVQTVQELSGLIGAAIADGEFAYVVETKTTYRLDRTATTGGVPSGDGYGRWLPFLSTGSAGMGFVDTNAATTSSSLYADLLDVTVTNVYGGAFLITFAASFFLTPGGDGQPTTFQVLVDGTLLATPSAATSGSMCPQVKGAALGRGVATLVTMTPPLAAGPHTVTVQWKVAEGTATISNTGPGLETSASLLVQEMS
ncbi:MAG: hypothetical protein ACHREM_00115 [Polyangiales bacterium]